MKKSRVKFTLLFLVFSPGFSSTLRFRYLSLSILFCCEFVDILTFLFIWFFAHLTWRKQCELEKKIITIFVDMFSLQPGRYIFFLFSLPVFRRSATLCTVLPTSQQTLQPEVPTSGWS